MATKTQAKSQQTKESNALPMKIDVKINGVRPGQNPVAFASVNFNDCFAVKGLKIFDGSKGTFVGMPSVKDNKGEYNDIAFPITKEFREQLNAAVLSAYEQAQNQTHEQSQKQAAPTAPEPTEQSAEMSMA